MPRTLLIGLDLSSPLSPNCTKAEQKAHNKALKKYNKEEQIFIYYTQKSKTPISKSDMYYLEQNGTYERTTNSRFGAVAPIVKQRDTQNIINNYNIK